MHAECVGRKNKEYRKRRGCNRESGFVVLVFGGLGIELGSESLQGAMFCVHGCPSRERASSRLVCDACAAIIDGRETYA